MRFLRTATALMLPAFTLSMPAPAPVPNAPAASALYSAVHSAECKIVNVVVTVLKAIPTATSFCSSYLKIATVTSTSTATQIVPTTSITYFTTVTLTVPSVATATETSIATVYTTTETSVIPTTTTITADTITYSECSGSVIGPTAVPTVQKRGLPGALAAFAAAQVSTACLCLNVPTPTYSTTITATSISTAVLSLTSTTTTTIVTATMTSTEIITTSLASTTSVFSTSTVISTPSTTIESCPAPTLCNNQGLGFAVYPNVDGSNPSGSNPYSNFIPEGYKKTTPECTGVTNSLGGFVYAANPNGITIYGQCYIPTSDYFVINQRGYIFAQQTGTYTFTASNIDDIVEVWLGSTAFSGWTRANANLDQAIYEVNPQPYSVQLTAGQYYPLRIVFGQAQGAAAFEMTVTAPDGTEFLGPATGASPYLVSTSCDGTTAPAFPAFGNES